ncbi:hypothetical protein ANN_15454, partial [Periplaneta americana]
LQSCPAIDPNKLNVHLVPHTHDDVGWLKTLDQYYYGSNNSIQNAGVQYIIDSVLDALLKNPERRFIYVETAFFWKWWVEQDESTQGIVKDLVNEGRLEFIGGAWSMNDEAASHYQSTIDQFTWGLRKLNDTFGECGRPRIGWQIDPFGHSREMASMFAGMGYDGLFFSRLDFQDKENRLKTRTPELVWEGSANLGASADIFTSVLYNGYAAPKGFCFDVLCKDQPFIDDQKSPDYNVDQKIQDFVAFVKQQASSYTSQNIILTMGEDFHYQDANMWYKNLDKLIRYVNAADSSLNVFYSTPSCYLKAVNDAGLTYTTKQDDFFPYASDSHSYWTGYFTSRPTSKFFERMGNNFLQVTKQLVAMTQLEQAGESSIDSLREAMGVMQHHDAITGTEKQHVAEDYARLQYRAMEEARQAAESALNQLMSDGSNNVNFQNCLLLNVSRCQISEAEDRFVVTVYNPISRNVSHWVRFPVQAATYSVKDPTGNDFFSSEVPVQIVPIPPQVASAPEREGSSATHDLVFRTENLPPLGYRSFYVTKTSSSFEEVLPSADTTIGDSELRVVLDNSTGLVKSIVQNGVETSLSQQFYYYEGIIGDNVGADHRSSGAYIFRPKDSQPIPIASAADTKVYKGDIVDEIHQTFSSWLSQVVRIYKEENHVEFEWFVGPIPVDADGVGKEIISRFSSNLTTEGVFYTDSNGRELLERKRNYRPTWQFSTEEPVSGNYYPVTSKILIRDVAKGLEVAVLTDRAQGGSSIEDGQVELMFGPLNLPLSYNHTKKRGYSTHQVHRRLLHDDAFGVGEALNEQAFGQGLVARGRHYVLAGTTGAESPSLAAQEREVAQRKLLSPWLFFSSGGPSFEDWKNKYKMEYHGLLESLPANVQILTLEPWKNDTLLLRLEHILEKNEDAQLSEPVIVSYQNIFSTFVINSAQNTTLAANQWLEDSNRLVWKSATTRTSADLQPSAGVPSSVTLIPMQIGTYTLSVTRR